MGTDKAIFSLISGFLNAVNKKTLVSGIFCVISGFLNAVNQKT
jgi:hypothetical protein